MALSARNVERLQRLAHIVSSAAKNVAPRFGAIDEGRIAASVATREGIHPGARQHLLRLMRVNRRAAAAAAHLPSILRLMDRS